MRPHHDHLVDDERRDGLVALVLLLGGLDELLFAVPAIRALRSSLPRHKVVLAGHPSVGDAAVEWRIADSRLPARPWHLPRMFSPDVAVNLTDGGPYSHQLLLGLRPRRLVAFENAAVRVAGPRWDLMQVGERRLREHRRNRWCRLVAVGMDWEVDTRDGLLPHLVSPSRAKEAVVLIHPGGRSDRRWAAERFADVARVLYDRVGAAVRIVGLPGEEETAAAIAAAARLDDGQVWLPSTVRELSTTVAEARLVISGDTTVGHLAAACAVPGVHLHVADPDDVLGGTGSPGGTTARERGPLQVARRHRVLSGDVSVPDVLTATGDLIDVIPAQLTRAG